MEGTEGAGVKTDAAAAAAAPAAVSAAAEHDAAEPGTGDGVKTAAGGSGSQTAGASSSQTAGASEHATKKRKGAEGMCTIEQLYNNWRSLILSEVDTGSDITKEEYHNRQFLEAWCCIWQY